MGCDIHLHIELQINGKWEHYAAPHIDRWYRLFGALAGVRDKSEPPIVKPKGFPDNASVVTRIAREDYGSFGHTDSWLNHDEIIQLEDRLKQWSETDDSSTPRIDYDLEDDVLKTYCFGHSFTAHWRYDDIPYLPPSVDDVRFVFWFDS